MPSKSSAITVPAALTGDRSVRLVYSNDCTPGISRRKNKAGFRYLDASGRPVKDAVTLERIRALAIPPAYTDVWICAHSNGHLQATGRDARGRKQYRYHKLWRTLREREKFTHLRAFGKRLPALRRRLRRDLKTPGLPQQKVLALTVSMLEATLIRVGNREYLRDNRSYGLTTLRARHADFPRSGVARLRFRGKSGKAHELDVDDRQLVRLLRRCQRLPGQPLFQYLDDTGECHPIDSGMLNDYLHDVMGEEFTAKDFRTWGATLLAFQLLADIEVPAPPSERASAEQINGTVRTVAAALGNTPAVCRASYIHPIVFEAWRRHRLEQLDLSSPRRLEAGLLVLLSKP